MQISKLVLINLVHQVIHVQALGLRFHWLPDRNQGVLFIRFVLLRLGWSVSEFFALFYHLLNIYIDTCVDVLFLPWSYWILVLWIMSFYTLFWSFYAFTFTFGLKFLFLTYRRTYWSAFFIQTFLTRTFFDVYFLLW